MVHSLIPLLRVISRTHLPKYFCMATTQSSALARLRKATGYSLAKCKKALELNPGDLEKAELWLHAEARKGGWSQINLQNRAATQGLIGICSQNNAAAMVEVNCESDFVARNAEFQAFVSKVLSACLNYAASQNFNQDFTKIHLSTEELNHLKYENSSLADLAALATGKFGEKTILKRAAFIRSEGDILLSSFAHPGKSFPDLPGGVMGRFGALLAYQQKIGASHAIEQQVLLDFGHKLCQHIVGMNPRCLGEFTIEDINALQKKREQDEITSSDADEKLDSQPVVEKASSSEDDSQTSDDDDYDDEELKEEKDNLEKSEVDANETRLLHQTFLLDPAKVVGETLASLSLEVIDFERFECGDVNN